MKQVSLFDYEQADLKAISEATGKEMHDILDDMIHEYYLNHQDIFEKVKTSLPSDATCGSNAELSINKKDLLPNITTTEAVRSYLEKMFNKKVKDFAAFATEDTIEVGCIEFE